MENNQNINNFDSMLKQSLEGSQIPVPTGVWEAVGSSIGTKAIVAAKVASLKLVILKAVAGVVLAGGVGFGVYEFVKSETPIKNSIINTPITNNQSAPEVIVSDPILSSENPKDNKVSEAKIVESDSKEINTNPEVANVNEEEKTNPEIKVIETKENKNESVEKPEPTKKVESNTIKETPAPPPQKEIVKEENKFSANDVVIPDVFTPYELDGLNDCFSIKIENESVFILQIFDYENKKVFETLDKNNCWDGKNINTGQMSPKGVYSYKFIFELKTGYKGRLPGKVTLL